MARLQAETEVRGVHSHGPRAMPGYVTRLQKGHTNPVPNIIVTQEGPSYATLDGDGSLGQLVSHRAMLLAMREGY